MRLSVKVYCDYYLVAHFGTETGDYLVLLGDSNDCHSKGVDLSVGMQVTANHRNLEFKASVPDSTKQILIDFIVAY